MVALRQRTNCSSGAKVDRLAAQSGFLAHQLTAAFTSLRLFFGARQQLAGAVQARQQQPQARQYTTTKPPQQRLPADVKAGGGVSGVPGGETMDEIRARIFGSHIGNGLRSGRKVLRGKLLGTKIAAYYPKDIMKADPLMVSLKAERCAARLRC